MTKCPVCGMMVDEDTAPSLDYKGRTYYFMDEEHKELFENNPDQYLSRNVDKGTHT